MDPNIVPRFLGGGARADSRVAVPLACCGYLSLSRCWIRAVAIRRRCGSNSGYILPGNVSARGALTGSKGAARVSTSRGGLAPLHM